MRQSNMNIRAKVEKRRHKGCGNICEPTCLGFKRVCHVSHSLRQVGYLRSNDKNLRILLFFSSVFCSHGKLSDYWIIGLLDYWISTIPLIHHSINPLFYSAHLINGGMQFFNSKALGTILAVKP